MRFLKTLGSPVLTLWFVVAFVVYYMTGSVWSEEAFAKFISGLSGSWPVRMVYMVFLLNVTLRAIGSLIKDFRRDRIRMVLRSVLLLGMVLFFLSSFLSVNLRQTEWVLAGEGQVINLRWEMGPFRVLKIEPALKELTMKIDTSEIFDSEPKAVIETLDGKIFKIGAFPARKVSRTYVHVLNFGLAPGLELYKDGRLLQRGYMALRILPFGSVDRFKIEGLAYDFYIHILPNRVIKRGDISAREYNTRSPVYNLEILKADRKILNTTVEREVSFEGYVLRFLRPVYWELLECVYDPVYPLFLLSLGMLALGVIIYPLSWLRK